MQHILEELGEAKPLQVGCDSSACKGILDRIGTGSLKHVSVKQLWLQEKVYQGEVSVEKIPRSENWADVMTHGWAAPDERHFQEMGIASVAQT